MRKKSLYIVSVLVAILLGLSFVGHAVQPISASTVSDQEDFTINIFGAESYHLGAYADWGDATELLVYVRIRVAWHAIEGHASTCIAYTKFGSSVISCDAGCWLCSVWWSETFEDSDYGWVLSEDAQDLWIRGDVSATCFYTWNYASDREIVRLR